MMQSTRRLPSVLWSRGLLRRSCVQSIQRVSMARYSESSKLTVSLDDSSGIAVLTMQNKPANLLDLDFLTDLNSALDQLHANKGCRGLIVTSGIRGVFSGGLMLTELYQLKPARFSLFWSMQQDVMLKIYGSRLATVAAINGHSPAGGCALAMCCDYRIMASGKYSIGLNEAQLGAVAPVWWAEIMTSLIGPRQTERALQLATLFRSDRAVKIGLVDEVCEEDQVVDKAKEEVQVLLKTSDHARYESKLHTRQPLVDKIMSRREEDIDTVMRSLDTPAVQIPMGRYLDSLKKKTKSN